MLIHSALAAIDNSFSSEIDRNEPRSRLGRRGLLGGIMALGGGTAYLGLGDKNVQAATTVSAPASAPLTLAPSFPDLPHVFAGRSMTDSKGWEQFRTRFIQADGRVVDTGNKGVSHTEGQGLGMLFAVTFNDRATFDRIWAWTSANLTRPGDALHAWRYVPGAPCPVADTNNASDGDIYIAGALVRAAVLWREPRYLSAAATITRDLLSLCVKEIGGRTVLLPGAYGFVKAGYAEVNLSYYVFPLLADLQGAFPSARLSRVIEDGRKLVAEAQFGRRRLPPDWLAVASNGALSVAPGRPARFSFDAIRVPLFAAWAGNAAADLGRFRAFWGAQPGKAPAWVDLETDALAPYTACRGVAAIAAVVAGCGGHAARPTMPGLAGDDDYYSAALNVLARVATYEAGFSRTDA